MNQHYVNTPSDPAADPFNPRIVSQLSIGIIFSIARSAPRHRTCNYLWIYSTFFAAVWVRLCAVVKLRSGWVEADKSHVETLMIHKLGFKKNTARLPQYY